MFSDDLVIDLDIVIMVEPISPIHFITVSRIELKHSSWVKFENLSTKCIISPCTYPSHLLIFSGIAHEVSTVKVAVPV